MDMILDVLAPEDQIKNLPLLELKAEWGGEAVSFTPARYSYRSVLIFHENKDYAYYRRQCGKEVQLGEKGLALTPKGEALSELEFLVNREKEAVEGHPLVMFLRELYDALERFAVLLFREEEYLDEKFIVTSADELIGRFCKSLEWENPRGGLFVKGR